ncbi:hypothetical protein N9I68_00380 [Bacteroidia bacterium]|nr:hypothetical protein [Bacteroidia bacterium]
MLGIKFSNLPRHRKFNYNPVFYDEAKDELHSRVDDIKREMGELTSSSDSVKDNIRRAYKSKQVNTRYGTAPSQKLYSLRIAIIAIILGLIFYYLWDSNLLEIIFGNIKK